MADYQFSQSARSTSPPGRNDRGPATRVPPISAPAIVERPTAHFSPHASPSHSSAPRPTPLDTDLEAFAKLKAAEFEQFRRERRGKFVASEPSCDELVHQDKKRNTGDHLRPPAQPMPTAEYCQSKQDPRYFRGLTYQDPLIQQELDNAIGIDDNDVISIALQPHILQAPLP